MQKWHTLGLVKRTVLLMASCALLSGAADGDLATAEKLFEEVKELYRQGEYQEGLTLARRMLEIRRTELGEQHRDTATAMGAVATMLKELGQCEEAERLYVGAMAIRERVLGIDHPDTANTMHGLAILYSVRSLYAKAEPLFQQVLAIRERVLGPQHKDTAATINNLAVLYDTLGAYDKAELLYKRAISIQESVVGAQHPSTANTTSNLATLYYTKGAYTEAEALGLRALDTFAKTLGERHPQFARTLNNLASLYTATGRYAKAEELATRALAIQEKEFGSDSPITTHSLANLAGVYQASKDYVRAEPLLQRTLAIQERALGENNAKTAEALFELANLYVSTRQYTKAGVLHERALAIREKVLGAEHQLTATSLDSLGKLYLATGQHAEAERALLRALAISEKTLGPQHLNTAQCLRDLASVYWAMQQPARALPLLQRSQRIVGAVQRQLLIWGSESRKQDQLRHLSHTVAQNASFSVAVNGPESAALGLRSVLQFKARALDAVSDSVSHLRQNLRPEHRALFEQLSATAGELSILTYRGAGNLTPEAYRQRTIELARQQEELEARLAELSSEFIQHSAEATVERVRSAVPKDAALVEWFKYEPFDPGTADANARSSAPRYVAYVLRHSGNPAAIDLGTAQEIEMLVRDFRAAVSDPQRNDVLVPAAALSSRLFTPLRPHLQGVRHLLMSPDDALNFVPMAALLDEHGRYLAERFELTYLTSGRDLLRIAKPSASNSTAAVVMADPNYGPRGRLVARTAPGITPVQRSDELDRSGLVFRSLPGTALEAQAINTLLSGTGARLLTGEQATEENLKRLRSPLILHLATHGFFLRDQQVGTPRGSSKAAQHDDVSIENPLLRSGLALAGANVRNSVGGDDGILTALEASQLDLQGTQLVVLSACETGLGEARNGESIAGLRRGLLLAGAQTQITSLWKVADLQTKGLMVKVYQNLVKGAGRSTALRRAQLELLADPMQSHPYYWASFVVVGDWKALPKLPTVGKTYPGSTVPISVPQR